MNTERILPFPGERVDTPDDLMAEALARISRIGTCTMATIDRKGRTRVRVVNAVWEGTTGYLLTWYRSLKSRHLRANPYMSLCYWDPQHQQVYADCRAELVEDVDEKRRIYQLFQDTPPPIGEDLSPYFGPDDPNYALFKLTPWRLELFEYANLRDRENRFWLDDG